MGNTFTLLLAQQPLYCTEKGNVPLVVFNYLHHKVCAGFGNATKNTTIMSSATNQIVQGGSLFNLYHNLYSVTVALDLLGFISHTSMYQLKVWLCLSSIVGMFCFCITGISLYPQGFQNRAMLLMPPEGLS